MDQIVRLSGGASHIGSHAGKSLAEANYSPVAFDSLVTGRHDAGQGRRARFTTHGRDDTTPEGICVRDDVHVIDLITTHLTGLEYPPQDGDSTVFNLRHGVWLFGPRGRRGGGLVTGEDAPAEDGPRRRATAPRWFRAARWRQRCRAGGRRIPRWSR